MKLFPENAEQMAMAGAAGSIIYWISNRQSPKNGLISIVVGAITAIYLGPAVSPILSQAFGASSEIPTHLSSYICGMMGISMNGLILDVFKGRLLSLRGVSQKAGETDDRE